MNHLRKDSNVINIEKGVIPHNHNTSRASNSRELNMSAKAKFISKGLVVIYSHFKKGKEGRLVHLDHVFAMTPKFDTIYPSSIPYDEILHHYRGLMRGICHHCVPLPLTGCALVGIGFFLFLERGVPLD